MRQLLIGLLGLVVFAAGCGRTAVKPTGSRDVQVGYATFYADRFHGRQTASGEVFDMHRLTAAHRTLPFGTRVRVTRLSNGRSVTVRINDRGPFGGGGRIIDLSLEAARRLGMIDKGKVRVRIEVLSIPKNRPRRRRS